MPAACQRIFPADPKGAPFLSAQFLHKVGNGIHSQNLLFTSLITCLKQVPFFFGLFLLLVKLTLIFKKSK